MRTLGSCALGCFTEAKTSNKHLHARIMQVSRSTAKHFSVFEVFLCAQLLQELELEALWLCTSSLVPPDGGKGIPGAFHPLLVSHAWRSRKSTCTFGRYIPVDLSYPYLSPEMLANSPRAIQELKYVCKFFCGDIDQRISLKRGVKFVEPITIAPGENTCPTKISTRESNSYRCDW